MKKEVCEMLVHVLSLADLLTVVLLVENCSNRYMIYNKVCLCLHNDMRALIHACVCVWGEGRGSCVWVWAIVYVCICHLRDRKKIFLTSKDKNKVLKS